MAKNMKKKQKKALAKAQKTALPQNILPVGERVEEKKNIYISQPVYNQIHKFTKNKTVNESGGMLIGEVVEELGKMNILISGFVEAKFCEGTPTTLTFTHETWDYVHKQIDKKYPGKKIVGWIHTHPDFGIFLSDYDMFIHENFFSDDTQVAFVVDPIQKIEGFYFWIDGKIERCKGFFIYDETGKSIDIDPNADSEEEEKKPSAFSFKNIWIAFLSVVVAFLIFYNISMKNDFARLQQQQESLVSSANSALSSMQGQIASLQGVISNLQAQITELTGKLTELGVLPEETVPEETTDETSGETTDETTDETTEATTNE